jgi:hypothetical protein
LVQMNIRASDKPPLGNNQVVSPCDFEALSKRSFPREAVLALEQEQKDLSGRNIYNASEEATKLCQVLKSSVTEPQGTSLLVPSPCL